MKLTKFTIKNYRSITDGGQINLKDQSVLVGRNNEGKTTVLLALRLAMDTLKFHGRSFKSVGSVRFRQKNDYDWYRDFPISLQNNSRAKNTLFILNFELNEEERLDFYKVIKSRINSDLCIQISFDRENIGRILVPKRGSSSLSEKSEKIAKYIAEKIQFTYIPAVRTEQEALDVINEMVEEELAKLESDEEFRNALAVIENLQKPVLNKVADTIKNSLHKFLPNIESVQLRISDSARKYRLRKDYVIEIDDGDKTDIKYKGDGVKSLAAIGLLKDRNRIHNGASIIAIEEPESHLHPSAMHSLKAAVEELSIVNQLVISTHNPVFVDRDELSNNILVSNNKVKAVKRISEIRDCLGVRVSDNLENARKIILVEGECDSIIILKLIKEKSTKLSKLVKDGDLAIKYLGGVSKLNFMLKHYREMLCSCFVVVDNDDASKLTLNPLIDSKEVSNSSYSYLVAKGKKESEIENLFKIEIYLKLIEDEFGINLNATKFTSDTSKWSISLKRALESQGKVLSDSSLNMLKKNIAIQASQTSVYENVHECNREYLDNLILQLERKFVK
ncbi:MAG TPA: AAA family ATPase [Acinetobacter sp.]|nr:AAA family ATPase [Acinetobacter sp.]